MAIDLTAKEFAAILQGERKDYIKTNESGKKIIDVRDLSVENVNIRSIGLISPALNIHYDVNITNVTFQGDFCLASDFSRIQFYDCVFNSNCQITKSKGKEIQFKNIGNVNLILSQCEIESFDTAFDNFSMFLSDCTISKRLFIQGKKCNKFYIESGNYRSVGLKDTEYNSFEIKSGEFYDFIVTSGIFNNYFKIDGGEFKDWFRIENGEFNGTLEIHNAKIDSSKNFWIEGGRFDKILLNNFQPISFHIINKNNVTIRLLELELPFKKDSFLEIIRTPIEYIHFNNFTNLGTIIFNNVCSISQNPKMRISNSDLGKTTFIDCDLESFSLEFHSSKISEVFLAGTEMPHPESIVSRDNKQKRLALSQIKKIYENRGDLVEAGKYQAEEMNVYLQTLTMSWEKINVCLNKWTNNHGQSWQRALFVILVGSLFFYSFYCFFLGFEFDISLGGFCEYGRLLCFLPEFINPIRKAEFLPKMLLNESDEPKVSAIVYLWDNIGKIFITYFIYQFIAAFRKHGKKS